MPTQGYRIRMLRRSHPPSGPTRCIPDGHPEWNKAFLSVSPLAMASLQGLSNIGWSRVTTPVALDVVWRIAGDDTLLGPLTHNWTRRADPW